MPRVEILYYREGESVPLLQWLEQLPEDAMIRCLARLARLKALGHELRRPDSDYLRDDIYELRVRHLNIRYRMLYFFHERTFVRDLTWFLEAAGPRAARRDRPCSTQAAVEGGPHSTQL